MFGLKINYHSKWSWLLIKNELFPFDPSIDSPTLREKKIIPLALQNNFPFKVLLYLMKSSKPLISEKDVERISSMSDAEWKSFVGEVRGTIVTQPGKMPSSVRVDQVDREPDRSKPMPSGGGPRYPEFVHFGIRPAQLSYAGDPKYQKAWKQYVKLKHLLYNKPKITDADREKLEAKLEQLQDIRTKSSMKREVGVVC